ncbi:Transducin (beta)-like 3 [Geranomyces michiganensis]|nr:Transducin (beta)-like 3 [Geranomyces michiganensis]
MGSLAPAAKLHLKTSFKVSSTIESIYTGGKVQVTADERLLITAVAEDINILDLATGRTVMRLRSETDAISCFAVKPDGKHIVTASQSLLLKLWDLKTGDEVRSWKAHEAPVVAMDFDSTSTLVATGSADSTVKVWDADGGFCTHNFKGHSGIVSAVKFNTLGDDSIRLVSGSDDCKIRVWDLNTRACLATLDSHVSVVRSLDFSANGAYLVSGARDKVVCLWNMRTFELEKTLPIFESVETAGVLLSSTPLPESVAAGLVGAAGNRLLIYTGGDKGALRVWDVMAGECILAQPKQANTKHEILESIYLRNSHTLVAITSDQNLLFHDLATGLKRTRQIAGYNQEVLDLALLGADDSHLVVVTNTEQVRIYNLATMDCDILYGHSEIVMCVDRSRDGMLLASGARDHKVVVWKFRPEATDPAERYIQVGTCVGHTEPVSAVAFPRKSSSTVITGSYDRTIKVWDLPDALVAAASTKLDGEPAKLKTRYTFQAHDKDIQSLAVAPNDKVFASGALDKTAKLWSMEDGRLLGVFKGHRRGIWCVQFSPVDQILATSSTDKTIKLWNVADFSCVKTFEGHTNSVLQVSFLSAGMQLASCGSDGLLKLWTIRSNECVATLDGHEDRVWALAVHKDEKYIMSGSSDSTIVVWEDVTIEEQETKQREHEEQVLLEQDLATFLLKRDYKNAILLAMRLDKPHRLLTLFEEVHHTNHHLHPTSILGHPQVDAIVAGLSDTNLEKLLLHTRTWNANSRHARTAQAVLNVILRFVPADRVANLRKAKEVVDALTVYTERHQRIANSLVTQSFIVDYTVESMAGFEEIDADEDGEEDEDLDTWIGNMVIGNHVPAKGIDDADDMDNDARDEHGVAFEDAAGVEADTVAWSDPEDKDEEDDQDDSEEAEQDEQDSDAEEEDADDSSDAMDVDQ